MKKIVFLLIASLVLVSCGRDNEPIGPDNSGSNIETPVEPENPAVPEKPAEPEVKICYLKINNKSLSNTYQCYIDDMCIAVKPQSSYLFKEISNNEHTLYLYVVLYGEPIPEGPSCLTSVKMVPNVVKELNIPEQADLYIKNSSSDTYSVTINDGLFKFNLRGGITYTIENLDLYAKYKIDVVQQNGYLFYPTKKTYYYTMTGLMQNIFTFNP